MFGGFAPPQQSREEIRALEAQASFTIQGALTTAVVLYLSPFAIELAGKLF
ncbi:mitochondrial outer membrane translocase complex, subunit Tom5 [Mariannaea sp. PMI_226]|nr:mitochondrial outer membrane translocase complex, subunit Tom5 [Mariannaea sp. PMI_226]